MRRSFLSALGLEKSVIEQILDEHGQTMEAAKEKLKEDAEKQLGKQAEKANEAMETLRKEYESLKKETESIKKEAESRKGEGSTEDEWKTKFETLQSEFEEHKTASKKELDDYKAGVEAEKKTAEKKDILRKQLQADGANTKLIDLLETRFDMEKIELDGEKIKGWDELSKPIKEQYAEVFGTFETQGANPATPIKGDTSDPFIAGFDS